MLQVLVVEDLMVEKTNALLNECDTELLSRLEYHRVILATTWRSNVFRARASSSVDIVDEWELLESVKLSVKLWMTYEGITRNSNLLQLAKPLLSLLLRESWWHFLEE